MYLDYCHSFLCCLFFSVSRFLSPEISYLLVRRSDIIPNAIMHASAVYYYYATYLVRYLVKYNSSQEVVQQFIFFGIVVAPYRNTNLFCIRVGFNGTL